ARQVGYRNQVLDRIKQAQALATPNANLDQLRREAAGCLGDFAGLDALDINGLGANVSAIAIHPSEPLAAVISASLGQGGTSLLSLRDTKSGDEIASFTRPGRFSSVAFTADGKQFFAVCVGEGEPASALQNSALHSWIREEQNHWVAAAVR